MKALGIAATGMMAQQTNVDVISNNIANASTTGFKTARASFQDLLYENLQREGAQTSSQGTYLPVGIDVGRAVVGPGPAGAVPVVVDLGEAEVDRDAGGRLGLRVEVLAGVAVDERGRRDRSPLGVVGPESVGVGVQVVRWAPRPVAPVVGLVPAVPGVGQR